MTRIASMFMPHKSFVRSAAEDARAAGEPSHAAEQSGSTATTAEGDTPVKKAKKRRGKPRDGKRKRDDAGEEGAEQSTAVETQATPSAQASSSSGKGWGRDPEMAKRMKLSAQHADQRRQRRFDDHHSNVTCFACRAVGHAARDCPNVLLAAQGDATTAQQGSASGKRQGGKVGGEVTGGGRCYRCNGNDHPLSRCPELADPLNPTPFATCFICLGTGHLSASCPKSARGVYPKGGSCKVCGSVAHRAKDCPEEGNKREARDKFVNRDNVILGAGDEVVGDVGADEDDFMVARRTGLLEDQASKKRKKAKRVLVDDEAAGEELSSAVAAPPAPSKAKPKVVKF